MQMAVRTPVPSLTVAGKREHHCVTASGSMALPTCLAHFSTKEFPMLNFSLRRSALLSLLTLALALPATAQQPKTTEKELRDMAVFLVKTEKSLKAKDLPAYCQGTAEAPGYHEYIRSVCKAMARAEKRDPESCSDAVVKAQIAKDLQQCLAMPPEELARTTEKIDSAMEAFRKEAQLIGLDGNKLLEAARAQLK